MTISAVAVAQRSAAILAILADRTERIHLGSALFQIPARPPTTAAMAAATIDVISGGRFRMGLGVSGPQVSEGWYGVPFARPVARTREYVEIVRSALARKTVVHEGSEYRVPLEGAKPLKLLAKPVQRRIPVYLGAVGPKAVEQVGEIADGWLPFMVSPEHAATLRFELPAQTAVSAIGLRALSDNDDQAYGLEITRVRVTPHP